MEISVDFVKEILELNAGGYSREEINKIVSKKYNYDETYCFDTIRSVLANARKTMTDAEKAQIEENRKIHQEQMRKELADMVKSRAERDVLYTKTSVKLQQAIKSIALVKGIPESTLKMYVKRFYPTFYTEYNTDANINEEHFIKLANKIIDKSISKSDAEKMIGFSRMMKYLQENNTDLLEQVNSTFAYQSVYGPRSFEFANPNRVNFNNINMLIDILLEFRMPLNDMSEFVSENNDIFLHESSRITPEDLEDLLRSTTMSHSLEWYLAELNLDSIQNISEEIKERKKARFNEFAIKFRIIKSDIDQLNRYVTAETIVPMSSVMQKVNDHAHGEVYGFTNNDVRNLLKNIYKYGLTELDVYHYYGIPRISNSSIVRNFEIENIDDEIIFSGYQKMVSYNADYFYSRLQGRS